MSVHFTMETVLRTASIIMVHMNANVMKKDIIWARINIHVKVNLLWCMICNYYQYTVYYAIRINIQCII